jgi:hypothetical protein
MFLSIGVTGQTTVIPTGGESISSYGTISYSIGEVYYTSKGSQFNSTEGVQHLFIINSLLIKSKVQLIPYPNPTTNLLYFKVENNNYINLSYILYDLNGKVIKNGFIINPSSFISLKELPSQTYILKCFRGNTEENIFEIFKLN